MFYKMMINILFNKKIYKIKRSDLTCLCTMRESCYQCDYCMSFPRLLEKEEPNEDNSNWR